MVKRKHRKYHGHGRAGLTGAPTHAYIGTVAGTIHHASRAIAGRAYYLKKPI